MDASGHGRAGGWIGKRWGLWNCATAALLERGDASWAPPSIQVRNVLANGLERCHARFDCDDLTTVAKEFVVPVMRHYYFPTQDNVLVRIEKLGVLATSAGTRAKLVPEFMPTQVYRGRVEVDVPPGDKASFVIEQTTVGNCCTNKARLRARWPMEATQQGDEDRYTGYRRQPGQRLRSAFLRAPEFKFEGEPWVTWRRGDAGAESRPRDPSVFNPRAWRLQLRNVEPEDEWTIHWKLG